MFLFHATPVAGFNNIQIAPQTEKNRRAACRRSQIFPYRTQIFTDAHRFSGQNGIVSISWGETEFFETWSRYSVVNKNSVSFQMHTDFQTKMAERSVKILKICVQNSLSNRDRGCSTTPKSSGWDTSPCQKTNSSPIPSPQSPIPDPQSPTSPTEYCANSNPG